jgi:hypothetical protein
LKDKRKVVKSIIERLKAKFNLSVAEIGLQESRCDAEIGCAVVSNDPGFAHNVIEAAVRFIESDCRVEVLKIDRI